jgi:homopolymeric O-antigen transport system ATP-binding protein
MISDSNDTVPNPADHLSVGFHFVKTVIPRRTLAAGQYSIYVSLASRQADKFIVDNPQIVCGFNLDDLTSKRGNTRPGYFSTLLKWETEPASAQYNPA